MIQHFSTWQLWLFSLPSVVVFYLMICLINSRRRSLCRFESQTVSSWAYLLFLGGSVITWAMAWQHGTLPSWDKLAMDLAACLYFGQRSLRIWQSRQKHKFEREQHE